VNQILPFVHWTRARRETMTRHLAVPSAGTSLCGVDAVLPIAKHPSVYNRCPRCMRLYLATMTATDELVGVFDEMGRIKR